MSRKSRILIVDDSVVFRSQIRAALEQIPGLEIMGAASNGRIALDRMVDQPADLMILDLEMPVMGGLETLREMKRLGLKTKVVVFSSLTQQGAEATFEALRCGAVDYATKPGGPGGDDSGASTAAERIKAALTGKVQQLVDLLNPEAAKLSPSSGLFSLGRAPARPPKDWELFYPKAIVIGSSTGGPTALEDLFTKLRNADCVGPNNPLPYPILITQHMPPVFTATLAARLGAITGMPSAEGQAGEPVLANHIYVAPGGSHMSLAAAGAGTMIVLDKGPLRNSVRPAVDNLFETAAELFRKNCLAIILTGMGADGKIGCAAIADKGGSIMIQDRESSVVFGMPGAVFEDGNYDYMGNIGGIATQLGAIFAKRRLVAA